MIYFESESRKLENSETKVTIRNRDDEIWKQKRTKVFVFCPRSSVHLLFWCRTTGYNISIDIFDILYVMWRYLLNEITLQ